jgi:signal transduction histidine kinase
MSSLLDQVADWRADKTVPQEDEVRVEGLLAHARFLVVAVAAVAISVDPAQPTTFGAAASLILALYAVFAASLSALVRTVSDRYIAWRARTADWSARLFIFNPARASDGDLHLLRRLGAQIGPAPHRQIPHGAPARIVDIERARLARELHDGLIQSLIDGCGFAFAGRFSQTQLMPNGGPIVIKERVWAIGGELSIRSEPGRGSCLEIVWPFGRRYGPAEILSEWPAEKLVACPSDLSDVLYVGTRSR